MILLIFTLTYLLINLLIGFYASSRVKNSEDFTLAGRNLGLAFASCSIFATWFGAETIMSSSAEFAEGGLLAVIKEPFGAALCLLLLGLFFVRPLYRMKIVTMSDYFKIRFNQRSELLSAILMSLSYLSWIAAQMIAMGTIMSMLAAAAGFDLSITAGIFGGAILVTLYTMTGGMWAVSITDFFQTIIIIVGLLILTFVVLNQVGGLNNLLSQQPEGFFNFLPEPKVKSVLEYGEAWILIGLGSIPSPDIFQRTMAAKSEKIAVRSAYLAAFLYITIALLPLLIGLCGKELFPELLNGDAEKKQMLLSTLVLYHTPLIVQILFFGALLSAIMSTTSGTILAPATVVTENIIKPYFKNINEKSHLTILRLSVVAVSLMALFFACGGESIYELSAASSEFGLVSVFSPLVLGMWWQRSSSVGALASMISGLVSWILYDLIFPEALTPVVFVATPISLLSMILFSLIFPDKKK